MNYAIVESGMVVNVAVSDEPLDDSWIASDEAGIGWSYDGERFSRPLEARRAVPQSVGPFEARAALHAAGLLDAVEALIAHPDTDPLTRMAWERASEFRRDSQMIATMTAVLGWTEQQVDELFIAAGQVQA